MLQNNPSSLSFTQPPLCFFFIILHLLLPSPSLPCPISFLHLLLGTTTAPNSAFVLRPHSPVFPSKTLTPKKPKPPLPSSSGIAILSSPASPPAALYKVFAHVPKDEVENRIEQINKVTSQKLEKLEEEKESILAQMAELKKILYAKFNDSINLEED
ncbi:putative prefoldin subunit 4 [Glycine max]|uniref:Putative prefoldin subunit 4 n=1 Tax=Glycine soja TaxID=3848 RepID=A0A445IKN1_GLYSO|nr:uncharacterized protein LOC106794803 [Glycine max]XP_028184744.1 uncharacterized protein LOC114371532 [Glycine soja]KAH1228530.1 putative prefoldin subunit 4 [Glycine max]RZB86615.1 putative prefoldin subunit 4 [Glycine soja]|eukprot:XP_014618172.1 uncharacterized protein LOC106794803 [Glycine max]